MMTVLSSEVQATQSVCQEKQSLQEVKWRDDIVMMIEGSVKKNFNI